MISRKLEICGFLGLSDIGSPMSVSRHLILPRAGSAIEAKIGKQDGAAAEYDKLESDIKVFYSKNDQTNNSDDEMQHQHQSSAATNSNGESVCVLLHGALKVENMAALVLLNDDWFGFIYSYADSKKKSNLMLTILPPGENFFNFIYRFRVLIGVAIKKSVTLSCLIYFFEYLYYSLILKHNLLPINWMVGKIKGKRRERKRGKARKKEWNRRKNWEWEKRGV